MVRSIGLVIGLAVGLAGVSGCGKSTTSVRGKVTHQGKTVTTGNVTVIASDNMSYAGMIDQNGNFTIEKVPTGPCKIGVTSINPAAQTGPGLARGSALGNKVIGVKPNTPPQEETRAASAGWFAIPQKYMDPVSSGLTGEIKAGTPLNVDLP